eukprot:maker-scaffold_3-snap-gene-18.49-mRNA-1 protein AED:0.06 eAED:0.07 QI:0/0/0/1/1/1/2/0/1001
MSDLNFNFTNLLGTSYKRGNLFFSPDGNSIYSPVGNRISVYDLIAHSTRTLKLEASADIISLTVDPLNGQILVVVDVDGRCIIYNTKTDNVLNRIKFKDKVLPGAVKFSPCMKFLAVGAGKILEIWKFSLSGQRVIQEKDTVTLDFSLPLNLKRRFFGHQGEIRSVHWLPNSEKLLTSSADGTVKLWDLFSKYEQVDEEFSDTTHMTFSGLKKGGIYACFVPNSNYNAYAEKGYKFSSSFWDIWIVSGSGAIQCWKWEVSNFLSDMSESEAENGSQNISETRSIEQKIVSDDDSYSSASGSDSEELAKGGWKLSEGFWTLRFKFLKYRPGCHVSSADVSPSVGILVLGYSDGVFSVCSTLDAQGNLAEPMEEEKDNSSVSSSDSNSSENSQKFKPHGDKLQTLQTLSLSSFPLTTCALSPNLESDWIAFGSSTLGQLIVWEWRSESFVLKQQSHSYFHNNSMVAAMDQKGRIVATGDAEGKVKLWSLKTGFSFVTFADHSAPITDLQFATSRGNSNIIVTASKDGTARAFDLVRYRNFRIFTAESDSSEGNVQFNCIAVDPSGATVAVGALSPPQIYLFSMRTGDVLDIFGGHEGPISSIDFMSSSLGSSGGGLLVSGSWDGTIRLWNVFERESRNQTESVLINVQVLKVKLRPDGKEVAVCGVDGSIYFYSTSDEEEEGRRFKGVIEGRRDLISGRKVGDIRMVSHDSATGFSCLSYTVDGDYVVAGGRSKFLCLYDVENKFLLKKIQLSINKSIDGVLDQLNSKSFIPQVGINIQEVLANTGEYQNEDEGFGEELETRVKGGAVGDVTKRMTFPEIRCNSVEFSVTGDQFIASTTEGLMVFNLDTNRFLNPVSIDSSALSPREILKLAEDEEYTRSFLSALKLYHTEPELGKVCYGLIAKKEAFEVVEGIEEEDLLSVLEIIADHIQGGKKIEIDLELMCLLLSKFDREVNAKVEKYIPVLKRIGRTIGEVRETIGKNIYENRYVLEYILNGREVEQKI